MKYFKFSNHSTQLAIFIVLFGTGLYFASVLVSIAGSGKISQSAASIISFFLPSIVFARLSAHYPAMYYLGFRKPVRLEIYFLTIIAVLGAFPVAIWLSEINHALPVPEWMIQMEQDAAKHTQALLQGTGILTMLLNIVVMALVPAFCEEVCFRGVLQRLVTQLSGVWAGIILTSLFFAALHLQFQGFLPRFLFSLILGAMYYYTGSLWTSIIAHFVINAIQVVAVSFELVSADENMAVPLLLVLVGTCIIIITLFRMKQLVKKPQISTGAIPIR